MDFKKFWIHNWLIDRSVDSKVKSLRPGKAPLQPAYRVNGILLLLLLFLAATVTLRQREFTIWPLLLYIIISLKRDLPGGRRNKARFPPLLFPRSPTRRRPSDGVRGGEHWDDGRCVLRWEERDPVLDQRHAPSQPHEGGGGTRFRFLELFLFLF